MKERERNKRLLLLLDHLIGCEDWSSVELIKTMVEKDTESMRKTFSLMKNGEV